MKAQVLKYWQLALPATRQLIICIFLIISNCSLGQSTGVKEIYYDIIQKISYEDTIVHPSALFVLQNGIKNGNYTEEDSLKYVSIIKNRKPAINRTTCNKVLKSTLKEEFLKMDGATRRYLTLDKTRDIIQKIPNEESFNDSSFGDIIIVNQDSSRKYSHFFSSPILIEDNEYIIYHYNHNNSLGGNAELIIAEIKNGNYEIKKRIFLWVS